MKYKQYEKLKARIKAKSSQEYEEKISKIVKLLKL